MDSASGNEVKVAIRVRPLLPKEKGVGLKSRWNCTENMISPDSSQTSSCSYVFDRVFNEDVSNRVVYEELASDIVKQAMIGFNGTLFTYGQSGSGKTYTIDALRTYAIRSAYDYIENCPSREFLMRVSYIELYNEKLMDLLSDENTTLTIREDNDRNVYIEGLKEIIVTSQDHVQNVLMTGNTRRTFAETKLNDRSSRAHCIFRLVIESRERDDPEHSAVYVSYLNLVDLAGSERAGENNGERLREGVLINLSLLTLSQVIRKLSGEQREYISYRDSKLTRILQNALEGNSKTAILCTVAPNSVEETHSTLRFALNAKKVKTKPRQNEVMTDGALLKKSQLEITRLKNIIKELEGRNSLQENHEELQHQREKWENLMREVSSFLCVSSKARDVTRPDKKRRETVCVPQIYRSAGVKASAALLPPIMPKGKFFEPLPKLEDIPGSPPLSESILSVSHPLDSPCSSNECPCRDMSFTDFEKAMVQESILEKMKAQKRECKTNLTLKNREITKLRQKLQHNSGQFVTERKKYEPSESPGPEFCNVIFDEESEKFEAKELQINRALFEGDVNTFVENEAAEYKEELDSVRAQLESLTSRVVELNKIKEESEETIMELHNRMSRDEEVIRTLKASEEKMALLYKEESERWNEKVKNLESEMNLLKIMYEEKGLLETSGVGQLEVNNDLEELSERRIEILKEWEQVSKFKEELNEQAKSVESKWCLMLEEKDKLNEERDRLYEEKERIHTEWNHLEKAHNDLRQEKENHSKEYGSIECLTERLHALEKENNKLLTSIKKAQNEIKRESKAFVYELFGQGLEKCVKSSVCDLESSFQLNRDNSKLVQEINIQSEAFDLEQNCINSEMKLDKGEVFGNEAQDREQDLEKVRLEENNVNQKNPISIKQDVEIIKDMDICILKEERATLLKELECLEISVSELNRRKEILEAETANFHFEKNDNDTEGCQLEITGLSEKERLKEEWDILRREQNEMSSKKSQLKEQEVVLQNSVDKCLILEEEIERLEKEVKLLREAQWEMRKEKEELDVTETGRMKFSNGIDHREVLNEGDKIDCKEKEKLDLVRQKEMLQKEWNKLQKYQVELSRQEEDVERKIERLCVLEEEKEQLEEEKLLFEREMEKLREAQKDLMKKQEALKHKECLDRLEQDCKESVVNCTLKDNNDLLRGSYTFENTERELSHEKEVIEQEQAKCDENELQHEKGEFKMEVVYIEKNISTGHENADEIRNGISAFIDEESGIITDISGGSNILCRSIQCSDEVMGLSAYEKNKLRTMEEDEKLPEESININQTESININQTQMNINKEKLSQRQNDMVKIPVNSEESQNFLDQKLLKERIDKVKHNEEDLKQKLKMLKEREEYVQKALEKVYMLQEKEEQLQAEKEIFQMEKERIQQETEAFKLEKEMFRGEKEDLHAKKVEENLKQELEMLKGKEEYVHKGIEKFHAFQEKEKQLQNEKEIFQTEKEKFQQEKEALKREKEFFNAEKGLHPCNDAKEIHDEPMNKVLSDIDGDKDDENHKDKLCIESKEGFQNEIDSFKLKQNECRKEVSSQTESSVYTHEGGNKLDNLKKCCDCLQQKHVLLVVDDKNGEEIDLSEICEMDNIELANTHLNDEKSIEFPERTQSDTSPGLENIAREREVINYEKSVDRERNTLSCDLVTNVDITWGSVYEKEKDKLEEEKNMLKEEWKNLILAQEDLGREKNVFMKLESDIKIKTEELQIIGEKEERLQQLLVDLKQAEESVKREQENQKKLEGNIQIEIEHLHALQQEKEMLCIEIERLHEEKSLLEKETERLFMENEIFEKKQAIFHEEKERFEQEKDLFHEETEQLCKEKNLFQDKATVFEEEQERCQMERRLLHEKNMVLEEKLLQLQKEKDNLEVKEAALQDKEKKFEKESDALIERLDVFQTEHCKYNKELQKLLEDKIQLQGERDRLVEVEKNVQETSENLKNAQECLEKSRKALNEKELAVENRIKRACILEDERQRFEEEFKKLRKAQEDVRNEKISLNEREVGFEEEKRNLQKEWDSVKKSLVSLNQDRATLIEKENHLKDERERIQSDWESLRQSQIDLKKEQEEISQKYKEVEEKVQAVIEIEKNTLSKVGEHAVMEAPEMQESCEELTKQLQELEDELEYYILELEKAEKKIADLENLIAKGKAILAEKIELVKQANGRSEELEKTIDDLKSTLTNQKSLLDTQSEELAKLKNIQAKYKTVVHEQDSLKKEIETLTKGRAGDRNYFEDIIRHLKLKIRETQSADASFLEQKVQSSQSGPSIDQLRRTIEFENAAKFLELSTLRKTVEEQKTHIKCLEDEKEQLQAECKTLQLHIDNETMRSEAALSSASQLAMGKCLVEKELVQLRKQFVKDPSQKNTSSVDETTKLLKEKDQLIEQLNRTLNIKNGKWTAIAHRHKELIDENRGLQKTVAQLHKDNAEIANLQTERAELGKLREDSVELARLQKEISEHKTLMHSNSEGLIALQKENAELKASLRKMKSELQEQTNKKEHKENEFRSESQQILQSQQHHKSTHENPASGQSLVQSQIAPTCRYGGAVESFVIACRDREIRELKKQLEVQLEALKTVEQNRDSNTPKSFGSDVKQSLEEHRHRRFLDNSSDKENQLPFHH